MRFANPHILWLLLVVPPALAAFFWWAWRKNTQLASRFIEARLLPNLLAGFSPSRRKLRLASILLAVICLIVALARPQWGFVWEEVKQRGLDIVVAIDTSKSMLAQDIAPNRLARAKLAALDLTAAAKTDRLGLVAFAGSAFLQCPLTIDDAAFRQSVESLDVTSISDGGTALADAITSALTAFDEGDNYKILVMLTDGEDHDSEAVAAAKAAAEQELQIFTIGIGTPEGELLRIRNATGEADYIRDEEGNVVKSRLNEDLLRQIAGATQRGFYLPLRGAKTIDTLYREGLAPLPKSESSEKLVKRYYERFHWPLAMAIVLLAGEMFFPERKRRRAPNTVGALKPVQAALLAGCIFGALSAHASPSSALREYKSGDYQDALNEYKKLLERKPDDPRLHFNAGTAAYRAGDYEEAVKQFEKALSAQDLAIQQQAYYNRGNTLYRLGENIPDPSAKQEAWQRSIKDFESSLKLNAQDTDAKFNEEFVRRKLEELKQQQQQQQQNQDQSQDQEQQQSSQSQQSKDQPQQQDQKQQQQQQQQQQQAQQQQQQQRAAEEDKKQQQAAQKDSEQKEQQAAQASQTEEKGEEEREEAQAAAAGQMSPEQARQLLDSQKAEEKVLPMAPENRKDNSSRPKRDW